MMDRFGVPSGIQQMWQITLQSPRLTINFSILNPAILGIIPQS